MNRKKNVFQKIARWKTRRWFGIILSLAVLGVPEGFFGFPTLQTGHIAQAEETDGGVRIEDLDEFRMDEQGVYYRFDESNMTASANAFEEEVYPADGKVVIPDYVRYEDKVYGVTGVLIKGDNEHITEISIPDHCFWLTFYGLPNLSKVILGKYTKIANNRLAGWQHDIDFIIGDNIFYEKIGKGIYTAVTELTSRDLVYYKDTGEELVRVAEGTRVIGNYAFCKHSVKKVVLPDTCQEIGEHAFEDCPLEHMYMGHVNILGYQALHNTHLEGLVFQNNLTVEGEAFSYDNAKILMINGTFTTVYSPFRLSLKACTEYLLVKKISWTRYARLTIDGTASVKGIVMSKDDGDEGTPYIGSDSVLEQQKNCTHEYGDVEVLYEDEFQTVTGRVCGNCRHVTDIQVQKSEEAYAAPVQEESYVTLALDSNNRDKQGVQYHLVDDGNYAFVKGFQTTEEVTLADYVKQEGKTYRVCGVYNNGTINNPGTINCAFASENAPKKLNTGKKCYYFGNGAFYLIGVEELHLGRNMRDNNYRFADEFTYWGWGKLGNLKKITLDSKNGYFMTEGNMLYSYNQNSLWQYIDKSEQTDYLDLPSWCELIRENAFYSGQVKAIDLEHITRINSSAFSNSALETICRINGDRGITLYDWSLSNCTSLKNVYIKKVNTRLNVETFNSCTQLENAVIDGVDMISAYAFWKCSNLKRVYISDSIRTIEGRIFDGCKSLKKLYIPPTVTDINSVAFEGCDNLTLYGEAGSYVETFASEQNIPFEAVDISKIQCDETVTIEDAHASVSIPYSSECGYFDISGKKEEKKEVPPYYVPARTTEPEQTEEPTATGIETEAPEQTEEPTATETPLVTATPVGWETSAPEPTGSVASGTPPVTGKETEGPEQTGEPSATGKETKGPEQTGEPSATGKETKGPEQTEEPPATLAPPVTATPVRWETSAPEPIGSVTGMPTETAPSPTEKATDFSGPEEPWTSYILSTNPPSIYVQWLDISQTATPGKVKNAVTSTTSKKSIKKKMLSVRPVIRLSKKKEGKERYLKIRLLEYKGTYLQVLFKKKGQSYKKLTTKKIVIRKYNGSFRVKYSKRKQTLWIKVRTYNVKNKKRIYSKYSKAKKIIT